MKSTKKTKHVLALLCATAVSLMLSTMPAHALEAGDTIYLVSSDKTITSATIQFHDGEPTVGEEILLFTSSSYSVTIPSGATEVSFMGTYSGGSPFSTGRVSLPGGSDNTYDLAIGDWIPLASVTPQETYDEPDLPESDGGQTNTNQSSTINVTGKLGATSGTTEEIVSVDVAWGAMEFTYTPANQGTWDPATHSYIGTSDASWTASGNDITVTNHSNVDVSASFAFEKAENSNIGGKFTNASQAELSAVDLNSAVGTAVNQAPTETVYFQIQSGAIQADTDSLGTITVTITKKS